MTRAVAGEGGLEREVVMITGGSRGLGRELALAFARAGARVSVCARSASELQGLRREMESKGLALHTAAADVADAVAIRGWVEAVRRDLAPPSVLINNASLLGERVPLGDHSLDAWRATLEVNLTGSFITIQAVLPEMLREGRGSIIQLSSGAAVVPRREWGAYAISKTAADALALNLAAELQDTGIRVNTVDPGAMRTGMRAAAYPEEDPATLHPPEDRTGIFLWLASDASHGVTGQRLLAAEFHPPTDPAAGGDPI
jgi:NAD(P)-dependent dehydrogenase (short-subunit alcohol dehydrogenase family)